MTHPTAQGLQQNQRLVKQVLSRELQLYHVKLASSLLPPTPKDYAKRTTALVSFRHGAVLYALLLYLVRWVAGESSMHLEQSPRPRWTEGARGASGCDWRIAGGFGVLRRAMGKLSTAVLPLLTFHCLAAPTVTPGRVHSHCSPPPPHSTHLRVSATQHPATRSSLDPQTMETLSLALVSTSKSQGTREGAVL